MTIELITLFGVLITLLIACITLMIRIHRQHTKLRASIDAVPLKYADRDEFTDAQADIQAHGLVITRHEREISKAKKKIWAAIQEDQKRLSDLEIFRAQIEERIKAK